MTSRIQKIVIDTKAAGPIAVYQQGKRGNGRIGVMTLHDLGCNFHEFFDFVNMDYMTPVVQRCFWVHIEIPGQGDGDEDLPSTYKFPTMQTIAQGLSEICDAMNFKHIILIGDGAGANILARLAMLRTDITLGAVLIHCTGTTAGFMESMRGVMNNWKLKAIGMQPDVESYLMLHRFGLQDAQIESARTEAELHQAITHFRKTLRKHMNMKNLNQFIRAFMDRTNITDCIDKMKCPALFLTGSVASFNHTVYTLYNALQNAIKDEPSRKGEVEIVDIEGVANVMRERPERVAETIRNFMQGLGVASSAVNRRLSSTGLIRGARHHSNSMSEYDQPKGVKNLFNYGNSTIKDVEGN